MSPSSRPLGKRNERLAPMTVRIWEPQAGSHGIRTKQFPKPWHVPMLVFHCTGVCRDKVPTDYFGFAVDSRYYNWASSAEHALERRGLVVKFCMN